MSRPPECTFQSIEPSLNTKDYLSTHSITPALLQAGQRTPHHIKQGSPHLPSSSSSRERPPARRPRGAQARPSSPPHSKGPAAGPRPLSRPPGASSSPAAPGPPPARTAAPHSERHRRAHSVAIDPAPLRRPLRPFRPPQPTQRVLPSIAPPSRQPIPAALTTSGAARGAGGGWLQG